MLFSTVLIFLPVECKSLNALEICSFRMHISFGKQPLNKSGAFLFCGKNSSEHVDKIPFKTLRYFFEKVRKNIEFVLLLLVPCTGQVHLIKHAQTRITFWFLNTLPATAYECPQVKRTGVISNSSWKLSNLANLRK